MKSDRLFNILYVLLNKKIVTAKELAEKFEVSTRTIYRDVDALSMAGVPIYTDKGTGGGIKLLSDFIFDKSIITGNEKNDIMLALDMIRATSYKDVEHTIDKLGALFNKKNTAYVDIDFSEFNSDNKREIFSKIKSALSNKNVLSMEYKSYDRAVNTRKIYPLKLVYKKHSWYLIAFCKMRNDYRTFKVARVQNIIVFDETFDRENYSVDDYNITYGTSDNETHITLILDISTLNRVEEEFFDHYKIVNEQIVVSFDSAENKHLYSYLLSYLDHIVDVNPKHIKQTLKEKVNKFLLI